MIRDYFERIGIEVLANITRDSRGADIQRAHDAALNVVECSGASLDLANMMTKRYGTAVLRIVFTDENTALLRGWRTPCSDGSRTGPGGELWLSGGRRTGVNLDDSFQSAVEKVE